MHYQQNLRRSLSFSNYKLFLLPASSQSLQVKCNFMYISKDSSNKATFCDNFNRNLAKFQKKKKKMLAFLVFSLTNNAPFIQTETSQLLCSVNQMTGFYMSGTLVVQGLNRTITFSDVCRCYRKRPVTWNGWSNFLWRIKWLKSRA